MEQTKAQKELQRLREKGRLFTNCYSEYIIEKAELLEEAEKAVLLYYEDHGVKRLIYFTLELKALREILETDKTQGCVLEFLTRNENENRTLLENAGFHMQAQMMRLSNLKCSGVFMESLVLHYLDDRMGVIADVSEAQEINHKLWSVFDTRVSHLLNDDEMTESIRRKELCIHRSEAGEIDAILQTVIQPRKFYINQVYNVAEKKVIHSMLLKRLKEYVDRGGQYLYAWVEKENVASVKFHQKYGMKHDGMWDMVYTRER